MIALRLILFACLLLLPVSGLAAAAPDGEAFQTCTVSAGTTCTMASKTTAGTNRVGIIHCGWYDQAIDISGVTWNGSSTGSAQIVDTGESTFFGLGSAMWRFINPPTASSTVVVTWPSGVTGGCAVSSYKDADQTTPISGFNSFANGGSVVASPITVTCPTASDEVVVDSVLFSQADVIAPTVGAGQTQIANQVFGTQYFQLASHQLGSTDGVMSWTFPGSGGMATTCASIKAAATASSLQSLMMTGVGQ